MTQREHKLAMAAGIIAGGAVLYLAVFTWALPTWTDMRDDIERSEGELATLERTIASRERHEAVYERRAALAMRYDSPEQAEQVFWNQLNVLAKAAGMSDPTITPRPPKLGEKHYNLVGFTFKVSCTLEQFLKFMRHYYQHQGAHRIESITLNPKGRYESGEGLLSVTMSMSAVVIPEGGKKPPKKR